MSTEEFHEAMDQAYASQARADARRREHHYQVRLPADTSKRLQAYMESHRLNANQALIHIVTTFFN